jgi:hypothetical protein
MRQTKSAEKLVILPITLLITGGIRRILTTLLKRGLVSRLRLKKVM